ncbi:MAG: serine protease [Alphaproteobacteria bacterium]|nr:MAG: serine protease [Alphaproteobacteria bacterium]
MRKIFLVICCLFLPLILTIGLTRAVAAPVVQITIDGPIGPGVSSFVVRAIEASQDREISAILLTMDTPGGLDTSMREIIQAILESDKPVICFVAPSGARAASAGTYILMACHIAAMAHGTTIGAATPVSIGGGAPSPGGGQPQPQKEQKPEQESDDKSGSKPKQAPTSKPGMSEKILNDSAAYMRGLAEMRNRPVDWAERFVREAASVSDSEALKYGIIDYREASIRHLLRAVDGKQIDVKGTVWTLDTNNSEIVRVLPTWRDEFLAAISNPNIAYILLLIGIYGLIFEFSNPGFILPGIVGAASLIMALYALQMLPVNYAGLALLVLGLALITAEAFVPSFGILGIGGIVTFVFGSIMLFDSDLPGFQVSPYLIGGLATISSMLGLMFITMAVRAWRRPAVSGPEGMIGIPGTIIDWHQGTGHVATHGEVWSAVCPENLKEDLKEDLRKGVQVRVTARDGLVLEVTPDNDEKPDNGDVK